MTYFTDAYVYVLINIRLFLLYKEPQKALAHCQYPYCLTCSREFIYMRGGKSGSDYAITLSY